MATSASSIGSSAKSSEGGYTFIEMVVAVGIIMVIATVALGYSRDTANRALLLRTQAQLVGLFNRAKSLSQNFQLTPPPGKIICSYGVFVDRLVNVGEFIVFRDLVPKSSACTSANHAYDPGDPDEKLTGELNNFRMDAKTLQFIGSADIASPDLVNVVFIPPNPDVLINNDTSINSSSVIIRLIGASTQFDIRTNKFAQITVQ